MTYLDLTRQRIQDAWNEGRTALLEPELYEILKYAGIGVPDYYLVPVSGERHHRDLPGDRVVVKVVSEAIAHKTELGGVRIVDNHPEAIAQAVDGILASVRKRGSEAVFLSVRSVMVSQFISCDGSLGSQLIVGMRFNPAVGHVLSLGFGGLEAEALASRFREGEGTTLFSPELLSPEEGLKLFLDSYAGKLMTGRTREARARMPDQGLLEIIQCFAGLASSLSNRPEFGFTITDFEINPLFLTEGRAVAVDALLHFSRETVDQHHCDIERIHRLLHPETAAIMGVSTTKVNVGRVILRNLLREEFPATAIRVIHPEAKDDSDVDGVACVRTLDDLPWTADLLVVAVGAEMVPDVVSGVLATAKAHSLVLIPGGMGETAAGKEKERQVKGALSQARKAGQFSPVIVGPNCLGIRSKPGRYDTLFIPQLKLPASTGQVRDVALISQSGAFMITRMNRIPVLDPSYCISTGNQLDLTQVDFVEALVDDDEIRVIGLYVEGFRPLDARRLARLIAGARNRGKDFVTYLTGRTSTGQTAAASHTASISGDYASTVAVLRGAGALVAETFDEFKHFLLLSGLMGSRTWSGNRIAAISNAGYESVGMADHLDDRHFRLSPLTEATVRRLTDVLKTHRLASLVTPHNPLDLTPMATDAAVGECVFAIMEDDTVDAAVVGMVPLTVALKTLPPGMDPRNHDTITAADSFPERMISVFRSTTKPMVFVIDAGALYDPLACRLEEACLPTFRSADVAMVTLQRFMRYRQRDISEPRP